VSVLALIYIRTDDVEAAKEQLMKLEYVLAFYELLERFNIGIIVELENEQAIFEFLALKVRTIPGVKETKTHLIQNGVMI
jgi:DNA-binding Lrp family transcriptional regulator